VEEPAVIETVTEWLEAAVWLVLVAQYVGWSVAYALAQKLWGVI